MINQHTILTRLSAFCPDPAESLLFHKCCSLLPTFFIIFLYSSEIIQVKQQWKILKLIIPATTIFQTTMLTFFFICKLHRHPVSFEPTKSPSTLSYGRRESIRTKTHQPKKITMPTFHSELKSSTSTAQPNIFTQWIKMMEAKLA